jgi:hypothetical protein
MGVWTPPSIHHPLESLANDQWPLLFQDAIDPIIYSSETGRQPWSLEAILVVDILNIPLAKQHDNGSLENEKSGRA